MYTGAPRPRFSSKLSASKERRKTMAAPECRAGTVSLRDASHPRGAGSVGVVSSRDARAESSPIPRLANRKEIEAVTDTPLLWDYPPSRLGNMACPRRSKNAKQSQRKANQTHSFRHIHPVYILHLRYGHAPPAAKNLFLRNRAIRPSPAGNVPVGDMACPRRSHCLLIPNPALKRANKSCYP